MSVVVGGVLGIAVTLCGCTAESSVDLSSMKLSDADVSSLRVFDYADWQSVLSRFVNAQGQVDYHGLKKDRAQLDRFVALLGLVGPKMRPDLFPKREQQLAYYLNAYNALTMFNVVNRFPKIKSVHDEKIDFFAFTRFHVGGDKVSLHELENEIVRPQFKEPRVHFALNCASAGCPVLPANFFDPAKIEQQLQAETEKFLHQPRNVRIEGEKVFLSEIFKWYAEDFEPDPLSWIAEQAPDLNLPVRRSVEYMPYDWTLNLQQPATKTNRALLP